MINRHCLTNLCEMLSQVVWVLTLVTNIEKVNF